MLIIKKIIEDALKRLDVSDTIILENLIIRIKYFPARGIYCLTLTDSKTWVNSMCEWDDNTAAITIRIEACILALHQRIKKL